MYSSPFVSFFLLSSLVISVSKLTKIYDDVQNIEDVPGLLKNQIEHFFSHYKDLEPNKWVKIEGWADIDAAKAEITESIERYNKTA